MDTSGTLAIAVTGLGFITTPLIIRSLTGHLDVWSLNAFRYSIALLFWLPFLIYRLKQRQFEQSTWHRAIVPTLLNLAMQVLWTASFYFLAPTVMSLLSKTSLIWIIVFSMVFYRDERRLLGSKLFLAGLPLCLIGLIAVLVFKEDFDLRATRIGVILSLASALSWGLYTVSIRHFLRDADSRTGFSVIAVYTTFGLVLLAMLFGNPLEGVTMPPSQWLALVVSAILGIAVGHVCYFVAIKRLGATISALAMLTTPFGIYVLSNLIFGELLTAPQWVAGTVLLVGAALVLLSQQKPADRL